MGSGSPASRVSIIRLWAASRPTYITPVRTSSSPVCRVFRTSSERGRVIVRAIGTLGFIGRSLLPSKNRFPVSDALTLRIDRPRKTGDVGGKHRGMNGQGCEPPSVAHRPDPQIVDVLKYLAFQFGYLGIRMRVTHPAQKGLFRQQHAFFRRSPDAHTDAT